MGDSKMLRTTAIAKNYSEEVIQYVNQRSIIESKTIKLLQYDYSIENGFILSQIN